MLETAFAGASLGQQPIGWNEFRNRYMSLQLAPTARDQLQALGLGPRAKDLQVPTPSRGQLSDSFGAVAAPAERQGAGGPRKAPPKLQAPRDSWADLKLGASFASELASSLLDDWLERVHSEIVYAGLLLVSNNKGTSDPRYCVLDTETFILFRKPLDPVHWRRPHQVFSIKDISKVEILSKGGFLLTAGKVMPFRTSCKQEAETWVRYLSQVMASAGRRAAADSPRAARERSPVASPSKAAPPNPFALSEARELLPGRAPREHTPPGRRSPGPAVEASPAQISRPLSPRRGNHRAIG